MTSLTFMGWTHLCYIPLCITTKLSRGQAAKRVGRRLEVGLDRDLQEGLRVLVRDGQQSFGRTRWNATALFPLLECSNRHAKQTCELRLRQTDLFSGRRHRWEVLNTADLASLELANAFQNLYANAAMLVLRHLRFPRGSASERAPECCRPRSWDTWSASRSLPALAAGSRSREFRPASRAQVVPT